LTTQPLLSPLPAPRAASLWSLLIWSAPVPNLVMPVALTSPFRIVVVPEWT
jgi:hypothetical protein